MEGVEDDVYLKAINKFRNPDYRRIFKKMKESRRIMWLKRTVPKGVFGRYLVVHWHIKSSRDTSSSSDSSCDSEDSFMELLMVKELHKRYIKIPMMTSVLNGREFILELLNGHPRRMYNLMRMDPSTFMLLCSTLRTNDFLQDDRSVSVEEAVGIFLATVSQSMRNRVVAEMFQHSNETVYRHFKKVLKALCLLGCLIIKPPNMDEIPPEIMTNPKFYPCIVSLAFTVDNSKQDCVGAIDGTHISACVPASKQIPFRGRKAQITQNIMCACSFDMLFTFVYTGWEGTANDARVLMDAISNEENKFPMPREGKYYVVDSAYTNMPRFLTPYRGERYHLRDFRGRSRQANGPMELFNHRHSSLRNVIERCFGVWKSRFPILKCMPNYPLRRQRLIPVACCTLHNFIRLNSRNDELFRQFMAEDLLMADEESSSTGQESTAIDIDVSAANIELMNNVRDDIAGTMWIYHQRRHHHQRL
ncbi:uncharacterized protein LOC113352220 [Papaver somniferum]|uniref:uncharacterized protein LOC113352220 n=1 Tax=Papaver somniferum TaxID=3469 RepID=UPI000E703870|nr:uncharacterized protein LOC113352220 [Papaver somniferum]